MPKLSLCGWSKTISMPTTIHRTNSINNRTHPNRVPTSSKSHSHTNRYCRYRFTQIQRDTMLLNVGFCLVTSFTCEEKNPKNSQSVNNGCTFNDLSVWIQPWYSQEPPWPGSKNRLQNMHSSSCKTCTSRPVAACQCGKNKWPTNEPIAFARYIWACSLHCTKIATDCWICSEEISFNPLWLLLTHILLSLNMSIFSYDMK